MVPYGLLGGRKRGSGAGKRCEMIKLTAETARYARIMALISRGVFMEK